MKISGIVRRIDDLGRIVIPKEIRKTLRIKNGENLEIFVSENENIVLKKYNQIDKLKSLSEEIAESIYNTIKKTTIITNSEKIISVAGANKKEYQDKDLSDDMIRKIYNRKEVLEEEKIKITDEEESISYALVPIISNGDIAGSVIILSKEETLTEEDFLIIKIIANFLSRYIEG